MTEAPTTSSTTTSTQAPTTTTADPRPSDEDQILDVVRRYWDVVVEANNPPDPDSPLWETVATGERLELLVQRSRERSAAGEGTRHPPLRMNQLPRIEILVVEDGVAAVNVCLRDDVILYDIATGEILDDEILHFWYQMIVAKLDEWLVVESNRIAKLSQEETCADAF
ncbi:MAG: hypothetical protein P8L46_07165 [Acidimicrobiales bacterium]|nr:hypothetical protein [Acidimicrobiales bacterium]MDG2217809.1 hypothetical protein [Acidimicrobiales bacterium]